MRSGFSIVEVAIVCLVIGVLSSLAVHSFRNTKQAAQRARSVVEIHTLATEIAQYDATHGRLPESLADIERADIVDPFGKPYEYTAAAAGDGNRAGVSAPAMEKSETPSDYCINIVASMAGPRGTRRVASICLISSDSLQHGDPVGWIRRD